MRSFLTASIAALILSSLCCVSIDPPSPIMRDPPHGDGAGGAGGRGGAAADVEE